MDKYNDNRSSVLDIPRLTKFDIFKYISHKNTNIHNDIEHFDITTTGEFIEATFCPLPPYCLIEDREKCLRAAD